MLMRMMLLLLLPICYSLRFLRPVDFLDASDNDSETTTPEKEVLQAVKSFYTALTTGDQEGIETVFSQSNSKEVSEVRTINVKQFVCF